MPRSRKNKNMKKSSKNQKRSKNISHNKKTKKHLRKMKGGFWDIGEDKNKQLLSSTKNKIKEFIKKKLIIDDKEKENVRTLAYNFLIKLYNNNFLEINKKQNELQDPMDFFVKNYQSDELKNYPDKATALANKYRSPGQPGQRVPPQQGFQQQGYPPQQQVFQQQPGFQQQQQGFRPR